MYHYPDMRNDYTSNYSILLQCKHPSREGINRINRVSHASVGGSDRKQGPRNNVVAGT